MTIYALDMDTNEAEQNHLTVFINPRLLGYDNQFLGLVGVLNWVREIIYCFFKSSLFKKNDNFLAPSLFK